MIGYHNYDKVYFWGAGVLGNQLPLCTNKVLIKSMIDYHNYDNFVWPCFPSLVVCSLLQAGAKLAYLSYSSAFSYVCACLLSLAS